VSLGGSVCLYRARPAQASLLASLAPLFRQMFLVCRNGKIPTNKFVSALLTCVREDGDLHGSAWATQAGSYVRRVAKQYRGLKLHSDKLKTCLMKAWGMQDKNRLGHLRAMSLYGVRLLYKTLGVGRL